MNAADTSAEYFRMREEQERGMAERAASGKVKEIHLALADRYRELADEADKRERE